MANKVNQVRQGDVFCERVEVAPKGKRLENPIIAYGEVTGHSHKIMTPALSELDAVVDEQGDIFVRNSKTSEPITIGHDEHAEVSLPAGEWFCISRQREYDPVEENNRLARD